MWRLSLARAVSFSGSTAAFVALVSVVYSETGSAAWVALAGFGAFGIPALVSPVAGVLGDRLDRKAVMICSDLLGVACFTAMAFVSSPYLLIGLSLAAAAVAAPLIPAAGASLPVIAADEELPWANGVMAVAGTVAGLVGPLVGGLLVAGPGAASVFALNAVSFLVSAALIASLRVDLRGKRAGVGRSGLWRGFSSLGRDPQMRAVALGLGLVFLGIGMTVPAEVALAAEFEVGPTGYGALLAFWGVGGMIGASAASRLLGRSRETNVLMATAAGVGACFVGAGVAPLFALVLLAFAVGGASEGVWQVTQQVVIQRRAADAVRSRVLAATEAITQLSFALPLVYAGFLVDWLGAKVVFGLAAVPCLLASLTLFHPQPEAAPVDLEATNV